MSNTQETNGAPSATTNTDRKEWNFADETRAAGLKEVTVQAMISEDFDTLDALQVMDEGDFNALKISRGQAATLRAWLVAIGNKNLSQPVSNGAGATESVVDDPNTGLSPNEHSQVPTKDLSHTSKKHAPPPPIAADDVPNAKSAAKAAIPTVPVPRPHEYVPDEKVASNSKWGDFLYGSLMILENKLVSGDKDIVGMTRHLSFCVLKYRQGYLPSSIIEYDGAFRDQVSQRGGVFPPTADMDLAVRHLVPPERSRRQRDPDSEKQGSSWNCFNL